MSILVVADADTLFAATTRGLLIYLDYHGPIKLHWSPLILDEVSRALVDTGRKQTLKEAKAHETRMAVPKYHCTDCNRYFRHRFAGIRPRRRATEAYRLEVFEAHDGGVSQRQLTRTHRIGSATVERWYQSFIHQRASELSGRTCPQVLGIDEHFFSRKKGYATTLVDLKHYKVFDVVLGRSEASLRGYLKRLPGKEHVRVIVMDLSETYRRIAQLPGPDPPV